MVQVHFLGQQDDLCKIECNIVKGEFVEWKNGRGKYCIVKEGVERVA